MISFREFLLLENKPKITINDDLTVDVYGSVDIRKVNLSVIPVQFRKVDGFFICDNNNLTSLKGAPKEVGGFFSCDSNKLTSLTGAPKEVGGDFYCKNNKNKFTEEDVKKISDVKGKIVV